MVIFVNMKAIPFIAGCLLSLTAPVLLAAQQKPYLDHLSDYIENLAVFEENQEPGRAFHIPEKHLSLNGTWKFAYYESPQDVPEDFFAPSFNDRRFSAMSPHRSLFCLRRSGEDGAGISMTIRRLSP